MENINLTFRRRPATRPPTRRPANRRQTVKRPPAGKSSARRPSVRRPLVRRPSEPRRPPARAPDYRQTPATAPPDRRPRAKRPSHGRPPVRRRPTYRSSASSSESAFSTYTSEYYGSDEGEESEHSLSTTVKTNIQMEKDGLGFIIIQNGPYLQLTGLVNNSAAERDGKLQAGDVLLKIGHANVLGWTLRELRQLLQGTPIRTVLQVQVYRDFLPLPGRWEAVMDHIPEKNGADTFSDASEESWTSSEGTEDYNDCSRETDSEDNRQTVTSHHAAQEDDAPPPARALQAKSVHYQDVYAVPGRPKATLVIPPSQAFSFVPTSQLQWISRDWHFFERKRHILTVGSDIGCDIMIHQGCGEETDLESDRCPLGDYWAAADNWNTEGDTGISTLHGTWLSPYWTMPKANIASSPSSSSLSDVFWLTDSAEDME